MAEEALEADGSYVPENIMVTGAAGTKCFFVRVASRGTPTSVVIGVAIIQPFISRHSIT